MTTPKTVFDACARSDQLLARASGPSLQQSVMTTTAVVILACLVVAAIL